MPNTDADEMFALFLALDDQEEGALAAGLLLALLELAFDDGGGSG